MKRNLLQHLKKVLLFNLQLPPEKGGLLSHATFFALHKLFPYFPLFRLHVVLMSNSQESQRAEEECIFPALSTFCGSQRALSAAGNCLLSSITAHTHMEGHFPQDSELQLYVGLFITRGSGPVYARTFKVVISIKTSIMLTFEQSYLCNILSSLFGS